MKYVEFKKHVLNRVVKEFGFRKKEKIYCYNTNEVIIIFNIQKSSYSNAADVSIGVSSIDALEFWGLSEPKRFEECRIYMPLNESVLDYELDKISIDTIDKDLDSFFENVFPNLLSIEKLKRYYSDKKTNLRLPMRQFWYGLDGK